MIQQIEEPTSMIRKVDPHTKLPSTGLALLLLCCIFFASCEIDTDSSQDSETEGSSSQDSETEGPSDTSVEIPPIDSVFYETVSAATFALG